MCLRLKDEWFKLVFCWSWLLRLGLNLRLEDFQLFSLFRIRLIVYVQLFSLGCRLVMKALVDSQLAVHRAKLRSGSLWRTLLVLRLRPGENWWYSLHLCNLLFYTSCYLLSSLKRHPYLLKIFLWIRLRYIQFSSGCESRLSINIDSQFLFEVL